MPQASPSDCIDPAIAELLALFAGPLEGLRFPDVDAATLGKLRDAVHLAAVEVADARALLEAAEVAAQGARAALAARCQRALAYARVYATDDPELSAALCAIDLGSPGDRLTGPTTPPLEVAAAAAAQRRRGRPPKPRGGGVLFATAQEPELATAAATPP